MTIVINNPAAKSGGAFTVLKDFLEKINSNTCNRKYVVFVSTPELKKYENKNIKIIILPVQNFLKRILWDNYFLKKYLEKNNIKTDLFFSLQNTGVNLPKEIPQIIIYNQLLSIVDFRWNLLKKEQRMYWLYKNIYPFFIKLYLNRISKIIVQTEWVKQNFINKFPKAQEKIIVIFPKINLPDVTKIKNIPNNKYRLFYPSAPIILKNHKVVIEALGLIKKENPTLTEKIECVFTFSTGDKPELDLLLKQYSLESIITLVGMLPYEKVLEYYKSSNMLIFPSFVECFGLPLAEAQEFNLEILTVDLPYAREVMKDYNKVEFLKYDDVEAWKKAITKKATS